MKEVIGSSYVTAQGRIESHSGEKLDNVKELHTLFRITSKSCMDDGTYYDPVIVEVEYFHEGRWVRAADFGASYVLSAASKAVMNNLSSDISEEAEAIMAWEREHGIDS